MIDHGKGIGKRPIPKQMPAKFTGVESFIPKRAPRFGQDNEYVFGTLLGMSKEELTKLEEEKVIGGTPAFPPGGQPALTSLKSKGQVGLTPITSVNLGKSMVKI